MDLNRLKYFITAAEEQCITRAAEKLHITQPPLTRHIHSLEEELGVSLMNRTGRGVELTEAGKVALKYAKEINDKVTNTVAQIGNVVSWNEGQIDVGIYGSAMLDIIPTILNEYSSSLPGVKVVLHISPRVSQIEALRGRRIMVSIDRHPSVPSDLNRELVSREKLWVAVNKSHPLAHESYISVEDLQGEPLIGEVDPYLHGICQPLFEHYAFSPLIAQRAVDMISAVAMVAGGFGSAFVPESTLALKLPNIVYLPLKTDMECFVDLHCVYSRDEASPLLHPLLQCVRRYQLENRRRIENEQRLRF